MTNDSPQSQPRRAFIAWDSTIDSIRFTLDVLRNEWPKGWSGFVPNLDTRQGEILRGVVLHELDPAECVIVYVDKANANVGFEAGFAVARGKRTILACADQPLPDWVRTQPPFKGFTVDTLDDLENVQAAIEQREGLKPPQKPVKGSTTLLLYPRNRVGKSLAKVFERVFARLGAKEGEAWRRPEPDRWSLVDLHQVLAGVGRVVWVIPNTNEERDGIENAAASVIAGYCYGLSLEVVVLEQKRERSVLDVAPLAKAPWESAADLERDLAALFEPKNEPTDVIALYRVYLLRAHSDLVPFFPGVRPEEIDEVCVDLELQRDARSQKRLERDAMADARFERSLRKLLEMPVGGDSPSTGRFVLFGDPGAGKATLCRRLCFERAPTVGGAGPIPVFVPLARYGASASELFDFVQEQVANLPGSAGPHGLAARLRELSKSPDALWWFFDGLDEVNTSSARERVLDLLKHPPAGRVVVTTRRHGYNALAGYVHFELVPLGEAAQQMLLRAWIPSRADHVWSEIRRSAALRGLAANPLLLTLIAQTSSAPDSSVPTQRRELYERAISDLLQRSYGLAKQPMKHWRAAREVLPRLSHDLHATRANEWESRDLGRVLRKLPKGKGKDGADTVREVIDGAWGTPEDFVAELGQNSGVIVADAVDGGRLRYLHRSLREYLAALEIVSWPQNDVLAFLKRLVEEDENRAKQRARAQGTKQEEDSFALWGEVFTHVCELVDEESGRTKLIEKTLKAHPRIGLRALVNTQTLEPSSAIELLRKSESWDGDHLLTLVRRWLERRDIARVLSLALELVNEAVSIKRAACVHYALTMARVPFDRSSFFESIGRPTPIAAEMEFARIPSTEESGGPFLMGSPDDGEGRRDTEGPPHRVALSSFQLGVTPVTEAQYARFDTSRKPSKGERELPVANVSWWEARLYCHWLHEHARLPTEAEWEYACRAGTTTRFWSGNGEADLARVDWYDGNTSEGNRRQPAKSKRAPNPWGLHDLHGSVWEWCADWFGPYGAADQVDPKGPDAGAARVLRGGSYWSVADWCCSAARNGGLPGDRGDGVGFRVCLCAPPS